MSLKTDSKYMERDLVNYYTLNAPAPRGTLLSYDSTDTSTVGLGDCAYGNVTPANIGAAGDREIGVLFYDVTATGPTFEDVVVGQLDLSSKAGLPCAIWELPQNAVFSTDQFLATGTGALTVGTGSGDTAAGTLLGIKNGQYVKAASFSGTNPGVVPRAKLVGNCVVDGVACVRVRVI